jgi:hypothetical protein
MREWRKTHPLTPEQRRKDIARSYANAYKRRGKLIPRPCWCGGEAEMHHPDYSRPLHVVWLCREHHRALHRDEPLRKAA